VKDWEILRTYSQLSLSYFVALSDAGRTVRNREGDM
jgi:hypothetical protein